MVEVMKIMLTSFKRSHSGTVTLSAPNPATGHHQPMPPPEIPGHPQASLCHVLWVTAPFSWVLVHTRFYLCSPRVCFPSCTGNSMLRLMVTSSKRAYAIPRSTAPRDPAPTAVHCWPIPPQETPKHSFVSVSVGSLDPGVHKVCLSPLSLSGRGYGVWFQPWSCPYYHLVRASPLPWDMGYLLKVTPAPYSHCSSTYCLIGASLPLHLGKFL